MARTYLLFAALNGLLVVMLGAFGAHALSARLDVAAMQTWHTAVQYQMFHTLGLAAVAALASKQHSINALLWSGRLFVVGLFLFCGSLYVLALTGVRALGAVTPIGGVAWLLAWALLAKTALAQPAN